MFCSLQALGTSLRPARSHQPGLTVPCGETTVQKPLQAGTLQQEMSWCGGATGRLGVPLGGALVNR